jgi:hypothetical protein
MLWSKIPSSTHAYLGRRCHCITPPALLASASVVVATVWGTLAMGQGAIVMGLKTMGRGRGGHSCKPNPYSGHD